MLSLNSLVQSYFWCSVCFVLTSFNMPDAISNMAVWFHIPNSSQSLFWDLSAQWSWLQNVVSWMWSLCEPLLILVQRADWSGVQVGPSSGRINWKFSKESARERTCVMIRKYLRSICLVIVYKMSEALFKSINI